MWLAALAWSTRLSLTSEPRHDAGDGIGLRPTRFRNQPLQPLAAGMPERIDGASEWLPAVVGRSRALEITIGANDFDADTAERYGWVNRSIPDAQLDGFVDGLARRIASYQTRAIELAKKTIKARVGVPA